MHLCLYYVNASYFNSSHGDETLWFSLSRPQTAGLHAAHRRLVNTIQKINGCSFLLIHSWYQTKAPFCYSLEASKQVMEQLVSHRLLVIRKKVLSYLSWWLNLWYRRDFDSLSILQKKWIHFVIMNYWLWTDEQKWQFYPFKIKKWRDVNIIWSHSHSENQLLTHAKYKEGCDCTKKLIFTQPSFKV